MSSPEQQRKSNSSSYGNDTDRYAMITDEKKRKRMISNRESARRSRMKREQHIKDLNEQITYFTTKINEMSRNINEFSGRYMAVESENRVLRMQAEELTRRLESLEKILASHNRRNNSCDTNNSNNSNAMASFNNDQFPAVMGTFEDPLLKPWMLHSQAIDGIYQF